MSHRFMARATLGAGCGVRPDAHARNSSGGSWVPGSARPRSRGLGHSAGCGARPDAHARSSSGGPWVSGSARPRSLSYGHQALASDLLALDA